jgi:hypothetical protein
LYIRTHLRDENQVELDILGSSHGLALVVARVEDYRLADNWQKGGENSESIYWPSYFPNAVKCEMAFAIDLIGTSGWRNHSSIFLGFK